MRKHYFVILANGMLMEATSALMSFERFMNRTILALIAMFIVVANINTRAQDVITIKKTYTCWNEAAQKDTTLYLRVDYGKKKDDISPKVLSFGINMTQGNPKITSIAGLWWDHVNIFSTASDNKAIIRYSDLRKQMDCLRRTFIKAKEIFLRWTDTAKREHVTSFKKIMTDNEIFDVPCSYRCVTADKEKFFYNLTQWQVDTLKTEFVVAENGECKLLWTGSRNLDNQSTVFDREEIEANYGGIIVRKQIKKKYSICADKAGLWFTSPEQIQSFIDALDYESIEKECVENFNNKKSRDELFK